MHKLVCYKFEFVTVVNFVLCVIPRCRYEIFLVFMLVSLRTFFCNYWLCWCACVLLVSFASFFFSILSLFSLNACAIDAARLYTELFVGPGALLVHCKML